MGMASPDVKLKRRCKCGCRFGIMMVSAITLQDRLLCKNCLVPPRFNWGDAVAENDKAIAAVAGRLSL